MLFEVCDGNISFGEDLISSCMSQPLSVLNSLL